MAFVAAVLCVAQTAMAAPGGAELSRQAASMETLDGLEATGAVKIVPDGPGGRKVLRADGELSLRIDLDKLGIDPTDYDLLKIEVKAERGAFLAASLENYPAAGPICHWYFLDGMRGPFEWRTIWLDLHRPEELKLPGDRKGMAEADATLRGLQLHGNLMNTRREGEPPGQHIWIGRIRFVKQAVHLDWDQTKAPYEWGEGKDLVFKYPLTVTNTLNRPVTALLRTVPFEVTHARAELAAERLTLAPGQTRTVEARVILPAGLAAKKPALYCERFEARASAEGIEDSEVTILRSSDPIHLTVTVPILEEKLRFPLLGRRKGLPDGVVAFPLEAAKGPADAATPQDLRNAVAAGGFEMARHWLGPLNWVREHGGQKPYDRPVDKGRSVINVGGRYLAGVTSAAYLYDFTGQKKYLEKASQLLLEAAELWPKAQREYEAREFRLMSEGLFCDNTLHLGFKIAGTTRPPYYYGGTRGNAALGSGSGVINAFDLVAADLEPKARRKIIDDFILPAGIRTRNQYIGPGNQQCTADYLAMYAGLAARNWPLVSFAYSSEHGLLNNIRWVFNDKGVAVEAVTRKPGYQEYTITPILWMLELLYHRGIDHYDLPAVRRFIDHFKYADFARFVKERRFSK